MSDTKLTAVVDNLIGRPYEEGGRGPVAFDCFGLLIWIYREARGILLPDPLESSKAQPVKRVLQELSELFTELSPRDALKPLDVMYLHIPGSASPDHLVVVENEQYAVHARFGSVSRVSLIRYSRFPNLKVYRLRAYLG